jgi:hypothetical protein
MHGPTCIFWANLTSFSLQRQQVQLLRTAAAEEKAAESTLRQELVDLQQKFALAGSDTSRFSHGELHDRAVDPWLLNHHLRAACRWATS